MSVIMDRNETKKCRIIPKKNRFVPDLLLNNQRIEYETTMEINTAEIARAMSLAEVYEIAEDGSEKLLTAENYYLKDEDDAAEEMNPGSSDTGE